MKRYGMVIRIEEGCVSEYRRFGADVWPEVPAAIQKCNIRNHSIFLKDNLLFRYFEYHSSDFKSDMANMAADRKTQEWWEITEPMPAAARNAALRRMVG